MFVVIINFPPINEGKDAEFREWFVWSKSRESFTAMQSSPGHEQAGEELDALLNGHPTHWLAPVAVGGVSRGVFEGAWPGVCRDLSL